MHQAISGWNTKLCIINLHCLQERQFWVYEQLFTEVHPSQPTFSFLNCSFCSLLLKPPLVTKDIVFSNLTYHYFFTDSRLQSWLEPLSQWTCCRKLLSSNFLYASINLQKIQFFTCETLQNILSLWTLIVVKRSSYSDSFWQLLSNCL